MSPTLGFLLILLIGVSAKPQRDIDVKVSKRSPGGNNRPTSNAVCIGIYFVCFRMLQDDPKNMMHRSKGLQKTDIYIGKSFNENKYNNNDVFYQMQAKFFGK
ncbi:unnamed protein product, partial [Iphiclides podalirius]